MKPTPRCPWPKRYKEHNHIATEHQVSIGIGGIITLLQPTIVVETGTFHGHTTRRILENLPEGATLHAYETNPDNARATLETCGDLADQLVLHQATIQDEPPQAYPIDVAFIDTAFKSRMADVRTILPLMRDAGFLLIHDTAVKLSIKHEAIDAIREYSGTNPYFVQPWTPRGLLIVQVYQPT